MTISEFFLSIGRQTARLMNIILNLLLILAISSLILSFFLPDYSMKIHHLIGNMPFSRINISFNLDDWNFIIQWLSIAYLLATAYFIFDDWLFPGGSNVQYIWRIFSDLLFAFILIEVIIRDTKIFDIFVKNIFWTILPLGFVIFYELIDSISTYTSRIKDKKLEK